mmetsp:Transcript_22755/g.43039  ORF Transcript_22755/g.43039 Transcript_22755/m.43039 type:complete len:352 (+) Transcript_22755:138-1193(+)
MPRLLLRILSSSSSFDSQRFVRAKYSTPPPRGSRLGRERRSHRGFRIVFHFFDRAACLGSRSSGDGNDGKDSELFVAFVASAILENRQGIGTSRVAFPSQSSQEGERDEQRQRSSIIISSNHNHNHNHRRSNNGEIAPRTKPRQSHPMASRPLHGVDAGREGRHHRHSLFLQSSRRHHFHNCFLCRFCRCRNNFHPWFQTPPLHRLLQPPRPPHPPPPPLHHHAHPLLPPPRTHQRHLLPRRPKRHPLRRTLHLRPRPLPRPLLPPRQKHRLAGEDTGTRRPEHLLRLERHGIQHRPHGGGSGGGDDLSLEKVRGRRGDDRLGHHRGVFGLHHLGDAMAIGDTEGYECSRE